MQNFTFFRKESRFVMQVTGPKVYKGFVTSCLGINAIKGEPKVGVQTRMEGRCFNERQLRRFPVSLSLCP